MQFEMPREINDHGFERYFFIQSGYPDVVQFFDVYILYHVDNMHVGIFPQLNQVAPVFLLIVLDRNPPVIIPKICIIRKYQGTFLVLQVNYSMRIIRGRIHHVSCDLLDGAILTITPFSQNKGVRHLFSVCLLASRWTVAAVSRPLCLSSLFHPSACFVSNRSRSIRDHDLKSLLPH